MVFRLDPSTFFTSKLLPTFHTSHVAPGAKLGVKGVSLILGGHKIIFGTLYRLVKCVQ